MAAEVSAAIGAQLPPMPPSASLAVSRCRGSRLNWSSNVAGGTLSLRLGRRRSAITMPVPLVVLLASVSPWKCMGPIGASGLSGSLDACNDDRINWDEAHTTIFSVIRGESPERHPAFSWVRALGLRGPPESDHSSCWLGWVCARFFALMTEPVTELAAFLQQDSLLFEMNLWVGSDWLPLLGSRWDVLTVVRGAAAAVMEDQRMAKHAWSGLEASCTDVERQLLDKLLHRRPGDAASDNHAANVGLVGDGTSQESADSHDRLLAWLAAEVLLSRPDINSSEPCRVHAKATALLIMGTSVGGFSRVTPGYSLREVQATLRSSLHHGVLTMLASPWPMLSLLARLSGEMLATQGRPDSEDDLAKAVVSASREEFPSLSPSFLPPVTRLERARLLETLKVTHQVLSLARVPYVAMTGTLLGAMRHHGFVPWDGDADVCVDVVAEPRLLRLATLQNHAGREPSSPELRAAARLLQATGFELFAHADRPLTYKLSGRSFPRVPGRLYGYPYVDVWFCHGWAEGTFSMQSANYGVPIPREFVFPRRKIYFGGLSLWSFGDPRHALSAYYQGPDDWFKMCVGHQTFHRQERKFSETKEQERFEGRVACHTLSGLFAFASEAITGLPNGLGEEAVLTRLNAWLLLTGRPAWRQTSDGLEGIVFDDFSVQADSIRFQEMFLVGTRIVQAGTSTLRLGQERLVHHLVDLKVEAVTDAQAGIDGGGDGASVSAGSARTDCDFVLRLIPIGLKITEVDTQLVAAIPPAASSTLVLEDSGDVAQAWRLEVVSCVCRRNLGSLRLEWVAEDS